MATTKEKPFIPTLAQLREDHERIAVARYVAKFDRFPTERDLEKELQSMRIATVTSKLAKTLSVVTRSQAEAYLSARGLDIPAHDEDTPRE